MSNDKQSQSPGQQVRQYISDLTDGLKSYQEAHRILKEYNLYRLLIWPAITLLIYFAIYWWLAFKATESIKNESLFGWEWYQNAMQWLSDRLWVFIVWFFISPNKIFVLTIISPFMSHLSTKVEEKLTGEKAPDIGFDGYLADMKRAFKLSIRNLIWETGLILAVSFIPYVKYPAGFAIAAFYSGFGYMDYTLERKRLDIPESITYMRKYRGLPLGLGLVWQFVMLIPIAGWIFIPAYTTVGATVEILKRNPKQGSMPIKPEKKEKTQKENHKKQSKENREK